MATAFQLDAHIDLLSSNKYNELKVYCNLNNRVLISILLFLQPADWLW